MGALVAAMQLQIQVLLQQVQVLEGELNQLQTEQSSTANTMGVKAPAGMEYGPTGQLEMISYPVAAVQEAKEPNIVCQSNPGQPQWKVCGYVK